MGTLSIGHMVILFLIVLVIFGPKNLPKVGQALGRGIREFKDAARGLSSELEEDERRADYNRREIDYGQRPHVDHHGTNYQASAPAEPANAPRDDERANS